MDRLFTYVGWLIAMGACGAAVLLYANLQNRESELESVRRELAGLLNARAEERDRRNERLSRELEETRARVVELEERVAAQAARPRASGSGASVPRRVSRESTQDVDAAALLEGVLAGVDENKPPAAQGRTPGGDAAEDSAARALNARANAQVNVLYREFIDALAMDPAGKDAVRAALRDYLRAAVRAGMASLEDGYGDHAGLEDEFARLDAQLHERLAALLAPADLAYFDEYQQAVAARQLAAGIETRLSLMAPELTPENQQLVLDIMLEETLARQTNAALVVPPDGALRVQDEAYQQLLARVAQYMDPAQYAVLERFVASQQEMAERFMGGMPAGADASAGP
jgi:hypothetical protein